MTTQTPSNPTRRQILSWARACGAQWRAHAANDGATVDDWCWSQLSRRYGSSKSTRAGRSRQVSGKGPADVKRAAGASVPAGTNAPRPHPRYAALEQSFVTFTEKVYRKSSGTPEGASGGGAPDQASGPAAGVRVEVLTGLFHAESRRVAALFDPPAGLIVFFDPELRLGRVPGRGELIWKVKPVSGGQGGRR